MWQRNIACFSTGVRIMPKSEEPLPNNDDPPDIMNVVKLASDRIAVERACRLIDSYIAEMWGPQPDRPEAA